MAKRGRPKIEYTDELADKICYLISVSNRGIHHIIKENDLPSWFTIWRWMQEKPDFYAKYARAREAQADFLAEEMLKISDEERLTTKTIDSDKGTTVEVSDNVNRSRLMLDARKWQASKLAPKKYGDKLDVTSNGETMKPSNIIMPKDDGGE
jgi:hypothetical protein